MLNAVFNFALYQYADRTEDGVITDNPVLVLTQTRGWFASKRRRSKITHKQLPHWFNAVKALRNRAYNSIEIPVKHYLLLVLFTGLRRDEAAPLIWEDAATSEALNKREVSYMSLKDKILFIDKTKNGIEHVLPLSDYIYELFTAYRNINPSRFVFPGLGGHSYIKEPRKIMAKVATASKMQHFILHDLRRTFATMANEIGIPAYTIKRLLNHKTASSDVTAGYIIDDVEYLRDPVNRIANYILEIAHQENG